MVHALGEIHRVLVPGGMLLDIRPLEAGWPVEVSSETGFEEAGRLTDEPQILADDEASGRAMAEVERRGWFRLEQAQEVPYFYYWDRPSEMKEFMETEWERIEKLEPDVLKTAQSAWASGGPDARVRVRVRLHVARWRKVSG